LILENASNHNLFSGGAPASIIADFDGVLAYHNTQLLLDACYKIISQYRPLDYSIFRQLFSSLVPHPLDLSIDFLLSSMDLNHIKAELVSALMSTNGGISESKTFIHHCIEKRIPLYILSTGNIQAEKYREIIELLGKDHVIAEPGLSKTNPEHYSRVTSTINLTPSKTLYIDDCPTALNAAKIAGYVTAMMCNSVFRREDLPSKQEFIKIIFNNWSDALLFLENR